nr:MAG TPA_asm: hypothetical protein [Caudoviricetes sp.]
MLYWLYLFLSRLLFTFTSKFPILFLQAPARAE